MKSPRIEFVRLMVPTIMTSNLMMAVDVLIKELGQFMGSETPAVLEGFEILEILKAELETRLRPN